VNAVIFEGDHELGRVTDVSWLELKTRRQQLLSFWIAASLRVGSTYTAVLDNNIRLTFLVAAKPDTNKPVRVSGLVTEVDPPTAKPPPRPKDPRRRHSRSARR
jgi:hypothetical protein